MASMLNLTPGYVSQLERGTKEPKGPSLALLNIIRSKASKQSSDSFTMRRNSVSRSRPHRRTHPHQHRLLL